MPLNTVAPVESMHETTTRMVAAAAASLVSQRSLSFEPPLQASCPNFGYAFECVGKAILICRDLANAGEVPDNKAIKAWASGTGTRDGESRAAMRGHHVNELVRTLLNECDDAVPELCRLIEHPFVKQALTVVTAFHAFLRYDWIDVLRREGYDVAFVATVFALQQWNLADLPAELPPYPMAQAEWHEKTFLPRVADTLVDIYIALTLGLARMTIALNDQSGRQLISHCVLELPERSEQVLGLKADSRWGEPSRGTWGEYCF